MSPQAQFWMETISLWQPMRSAFLFAWGAGDPLWLLATKRLFLILPLGAVALAYWTSVLSLPTIVVRAKRRTFVNLLLVTWWDLARATFTFWGGAFRFLLRLAISLFGALQMIVVGLWAVAQEVVLLPVRLIRNVGSNVLNPGVPWIAVAMTFFWCVFEAIVFTYVMTSLVIDTLSNLAGTQMTETAVRIPLFLFMFFIVLGSYAVLSTWTAALKTRDWATIVKIGVDLERLRWPCSSRSSSSTANSWTRWCPGSPSTPPETSSSGSRARWRSPGSPGSAFAASPGSSSPAPGRRR